MLWDMMEMAGYKNQSQQLHSKFFSRNTAKSLGPHPKASQGSDFWKSFMTDDHTPIEFSWNWSTKRKTPSVRYSIDPIGHSAGTLIDPFNTYDSINLLRKSLPLAPEVDLEWYEYFTKALTITGTELTHQEFISSNIPRSQQFLAFELAEESIMIKVYFLPQWKAMSTGESTLSLVEKSIQNLGLCDLSLVTGFDIIADYIQSFPEKDRPEVEIVAIDCINPAKSRIKIYLRSRRTCFDSVVDMMTLGGRLPSMTEKGFLSLEDLWCSVLSLDSSDVILPENAHRTAGILYYLELKAGSTIPKSKVYIPAKHYGGNDEAVARGLSEFLKKRGQCMVNGSTYLSGITQLCKHRGLADGLGFHTYISCAIEGDDLNVTSYYNPEIYHASRF
ncbi:aromatic prenyltransferase [Glonium stellatum]|uniref:Aromatic prenyltransferase n=1 Tax=Glonium stellatum TaxID=574774 RepID=A0A8E2EQ84_9PEZI|nr:aromatic prenyltransferase [Glonium stellatum]